MLGYLRVVGVIPAKEAKFTIMIEVNTEKLQKK